MRADGPSDQDLVMSYKGMRLAIGLVGLALPTVMIGYSLVAGQPLQASISAYAHTPMNEVFVGMLWAMGMFLFSYKGYERQDDIAGDIAGVAAIVTSLAKTNTVGVSRPEWEHLLHGGAAAVFFLCTAYFALVLFRKGSNAARNRVYLISGIVIIVALIGLAVIKQFVDVYTGIRPFFWLEAIAVWAFSFAWLVKGLPASKKLAVN